MTCAQQLRVEVFSINQKYSIWYICSSIVFAFRKSLTAMQIKSLFSLKLKAYLISEACICMIYQYDEGGKFHATYVLDPRSNWGGITEGCVTE